MHLSPDTLLQGRYRIRQLIAQGGMGAVYRATDERLGNTVALKQTLVGDPQLRAAFAREARLLASLHHPALPVVSDHFAEGSEQFLVMQFIPGDDLAALLQRRGAPFPLADVLPWADRLLDALDYLHTQSPPIIHRDIKPQNLKLTARGEIVLLDFGLAKGAPGQGSAAHSPSIFGYTPQYAPLEQIQGSGTDARSDLYSVGATLYELLTATPPPDALTRATAALSGRSDPLRPADELNPDVPAALAALLAAAMSLNPEQRPPSAAAMRAALRDATRPGAMPSGAVGQPQRPAPASSAGAVTVAIADASSAGQPTINIGAATVLSAPTPSPSSRRIIPRFIAIYAGLLLLCFLVIGGAILLRTWDGPGAAAADEEWVPVVDVGLSRAAPQQPNGVVFIQGWRVQLLEYARGAEAWNLLSQSAVSPEPAPEGWEYLLLKVRATHIGDSEQRAFDRGQIYVVGASSVAWDGFAAVPPEPSLDEMAQMQPGEKIEGWTVHLVRQDEPELVMCVGNLIDHSARFIALTPGASLSPDPALAQIEPTNLGADPREPALLGEPVTTGRYQATVLEVYRGEEAWRRILEGNRYNDPPAEGFEYALVRVRMRLLGAGDESALLYSGLFTGSSGAEIVEQVSIVEPKPELHEIVFPGGEAEGWVAVQIRAGDPAARLVLNGGLSSLSDSSNTRYFSLD